MPIADDRREQEKRNVSPSGTALDKQRKLAIASVIRQKRELDVYADLDPETDFEWGAIRGPGNSPLNYFDYYFTGQDIKIFIEGAEYTSISDPQSSPFAELSFSIQQEKTPVYGAWSYTYDAVMRGTRIVTGMFRLVTTYPNKMTDMLSQAANSRANSRGSLQPIRGLDVKEENIARYWDRNLEQADVNQTKKLFSAHPPFNLLIQYGIQSTHLVDGPNKRYTELFRRYHEDTAMYTNTNERLMHAGTDGNETTIVLTNVELTGMQTEYTADGTVCSEVYSFFAKDQTLPRRF